MTETTVDFLLRFPDGSYLCKTRTNTPFRSNHLNAVSFDTRSKAEYGRDKITRGDTIIVIRKAILDDEEKELDTRVERFTVPRCP